MAVQKLIFSFLLSALVCFGSSWFLAYRHVFDRNQGFGEGGLSAIWFWTVPYCICLGILAVWLTWSIAIESTVKRYALLGGAGIASAIIYSYLVMFLMGPWFGAFSVPVGWVWMTSGCAGMVASNYRNGETRMTRIFTNLVLAGCVVIFGYITVNTEIIASIVRNKPVKFVWVKWQRNGESISVDKEKALQLTDAEVQLLASNRLTGKLEVVGTNGESELRMVVIAEKQIDSPVELALPKESSIIYVQKDAGWIVLPQGNPTSNEKILLEPKDNTTMFSINEDDMIIGGGAFLWQDEKVDDQPLKPH